MCAEYNHEDSAVELAEAVRSGLLGGAGGPGSDAGGGASLQRAQRENDEETQREESSSTESTHQEVIHTCVQTCKCVGLFMIASEI